MNAAELIEYLKAVPPETPVLKIYEDDFLPVIPRIEKVRRLSRACFLSLGRCSDGEIAEVVVIGC